MATVRMLVGMVGPGESWKPGDTRPISDETAKAWEAAGIAAIVPDGDAVVGAVVSGDGSGDAAPESVPGGATPKTQGHTKRTRKAKK